MLLIREYKRVSQLRISCNNGWNFPCELRLINIMDNIYIPPTHKDSETPLVSEGVKWEK